MLSEDFKKQVKGYGLTTAEILKVQESMISRFGLSM